MFFRISESKNSNTTDTQLNLTTTEAPSQGERIQCVALQPLGDNLNPHRAIHMDMIRRFSLAMESLNITKWHLMGGSLLGW